MWIIAGPNGAGKSTFANRLLVNLGHPDLIKLNADEVTARYRAADTTAPQDELNLRAARFIDSEVVRCIEEGRDFLVETVLSSGKYRDDVEKAQAAGYQIGLVYVSIFPPELSPARVSERARKGGHDVNHDTAIARYHRSHRELVWFVQRADHLVIFDNSAADGKPVLITSRFGQERYYVPGINPTVDEVMTQAFPSA
jgi:predicted ABC-type ATPase